MSIEDTNLLLAAGLGCVVGIILAITVCYLLFRRTLLNAHESEMRMHARAVEYKNRADKAEAACSAYKRQITTINYVQPKPGLTTVRGRF